MYRCVYCGGAKRAGWPCPTCDPEGYAERKADVARTFTAEVRARLSEVNRQRAAKMTEAQRRKRASLGGKAKAKKGITTGNYTSDTGRQAAIKRWWGELEQPPVHGDDA